MRRKRKNTNLLEIFERIINWIFDKRYAIIFSMCTYLILIVFLILSEINTFCRPKPTNIVISFDQDILKKIEKLKEIKQEKIKEQKKINEQAVNKLLKSIAVNEDIKKKSNKTSVKEDVSKMIKDLEKDLASRGIGRKKKDYKSFKKDSIAHSKEEAERKLDSLKTTFYKGPSSVSYSLKGRYKTYLPIPVYTCESSGTVKINVVVNKYGRVVSARIESSGTNTRNEILLETALSYARKSRFNEKLEINEQSGSITYRFARQ